MLAVETVATSSGTNRVELVDEDDRGRMISCLGEELPDASRPEAREHLDERRRALRVELRTRLVGGCACEQRLPCSRRAVQQHAFRHDCTELVKAFRIAEELNDLEQLRLRLVGAGDVTPLDGRARVDDDRRRLDARH